MCHSSIFLENKGEVEINRMIRKVMVRPSAAGDLDAVALETALLNTWKEENAFKSSIGSSKDGAPFIFLEGPGMLPDCFA